MAGEELGVDEVKRRWKEEEVEEAFRGHSEEIGREGIGGRRRLRYGQIAMRKMSEMGDRPCLAQMKYSRQQ